MASFYLFIYFKKEMEVEPTPFQQFSMQEFPQPHLIAICWKA